MIIIDSFTAILILLSITTWSIWLLRPTELSKVLGKPGILPREPAHKEAISKLSRSLDALHVVKLVAIGYSLSFLLKDSGDVISGGAALKEVIILSGLLAFLDIALLGYVRVLKLKDTINDYALILLKTIVYRLGICILFSISLG